MRRLWRWIGRSVLVVAVSAAWAAWWVLPPRPLAEWMTTCRHPVESLLTPDRSRLVCLTARYHFFDMNFASAAEYGPIRVWDLGTGRERLTIPGDGAWCGDAPRMWAAPDGVSLLTTWPRSRGKGTLSLWDNETGSERWSIPITDSCPHRLPAPVVSPDGRWVACRQGEPAMTNVLGVATGEIRLTLAGAWPVAFTTDGETVAAVSNPVVGAHRLATVALWDMASARPRREIVTGQRSAGVVALSPDGRWLAVGLPTTVSNTPPPVETIELWDLRSERQKAAATFDVPAN